MIVSSFHLKKRVVPIGFLGLFFWAANGLLLAQSRHENHFSVAPLRTESLDIEFLVFEAQQQVVNAKMKVANKTDQYVVYQPFESLFKLPNGNFAPTGGKIFSFRPHEQKEVTVKSKSTDNSFHVTQLELSLTGFYRIDSLSNAKTLQDTWLVQSDKYAKTEVRKELPGHFKLLPARVFENYVEGDFYYKINRLVFDDHILVRMEIGYTGDKIGAVDPSKMTLLVNNTIQIPNTANESALAPRFLGKGNSYEQVMVFELPKKLGKDPIFQLQWNKALSEPTLVPLQVGEVKGTFEPSK